VNLLESALHYAAAGWPVFPCNPRTKQPLVKGDTDPETGKPIPATGGVKKASTDPEQIRAWWKRWPKAMIGLACGNAAGVFVLDVDAGVDKDTGEEFTLAALLAQLREELGEELPETWTVATPRGGRHFYFQLPAPDFGNTKGKLPLRFDVRGEGGYVVLPPSRRDDGKSYTWLQAPGPGDLAAVAPPALIDCINKVGRFADPKHQAPARAARPAERSSPAEASQAADEAVRRYALAAFDAELRELQGAMPGTRNNAINEAAFSLGQLVGAGALMEGAVRAALQAVVADWPDRVKSYQTIESGLRGGKGKPRELQEIKDAAAERARRRADAAPAAPPPDDLSAYGEHSQMGAPAGSAALKLRRGLRSNVKRPHDRNLKAAQAESEDDLNLRLARLPLTDLGNAERFRERNRGKLLWCREIDGNWLWWDGLRWRREGGEARARIAEHECVRAIKLEAEALRKSGKDWILAPGRPKKEKPPSHQQKVITMMAALAGAAPVDPPQDPVDQAEAEGAAVMYSDRLEAFGRSCEDAGRLAPIARHAQAYLAVSTSELDADRFAINLLNGTLHAGHDPDGTPYIHFAPHDPDDLITKMAPVAFDQDAICPAYDRFLEQVQPNADNRRFLHQWGGYSFIGDVAEQRLVFHWGKGRNGKSTLQDAWGNVFGDYGTSAPIETFLSDGRQRQGSAASPDLAMLKGVRFVRTSEPDKGAKLGEALIKLVTGGEPFPARELNKSFFMLVPQFKLTISGNYRPKITGTDEGIWRRVTLVPWTVTIDKDKVDRALPLKLAAEGAGILNRLLAGLYDWLQHGLIIPRDVEGATADYRRDSDPLGRFLDACVAADPGGRVRSSDLHKVFCAWCRANGEHEWKPTGFGLAMSDRGFQSFKSNVSYWLDLKLTKAESDFVDGEGRPLVEQQGGSEENKGAADDEVPF
jgi:putative DNA primase/helicase